MRYLHDIWVAQAQSALDGIVEVSGETFQFRHFNLGNFKWIACDADDSFAVISYRCDGYPSQRVTLGSPSGSVKKLRLLDDPTAIAEWIVYHLVDGDKAEGLPEVMTNGFWYALR